VSSVTSVVKNYRSPVPTIDHALDAISEAGDVEIDEQADVFSAEAQIRQ
jgi:hypothetical protein